MYVPAKLLTRPTRVHLDSSSPILQIPSELSPARKEQLPPHLPLPFMHPVKHDSNILQTKVTSRASILKDLLDLLLRKAMVCHGMRSSVRWLGIHNILVAPLVVLSLAVSKRVRGKTHIHLPMGEKVKDQNDSAWLETLDEPACCEGRVVKMVES